MDRRIISNIEAKMRRPKMINRIILVAIAFVYSHVCGAAEPADFTFFYEYPSGGFGSAGLPNGVSPSDISPDKIRLEHIITFLDIYEKNVRQGTLKGTRGSTRGARGSEEAFYITSFVGDERFSSFIYDHYAEPLFEEFGDKEASTVLLYYQTGGSLEKLRALYQQPIDDVVKRAIETCFFDASVGLLENTEQDVVDATSNPLTITLSTKFRTTKYYTYDKGGEPPLTDLFGGPVEGAEGDWTLHERTTDKHDLFITYKNTSRNKLIRFEVPRRKNGNCWCGLKMIRTGGVPVLASGYLVTHDHENQLITLYPGDQYIQKMDVNFSVTLPGVLMAQLFSDFDRYVVRQGDYRVGNADDDFRVTLKYACNYIAAKSVEGLNQMKASDWKAVRSNSLDLEYVHGSPSTTQTSKERAWENIMKSWEDIP